jgi:DNA-binding response OmpR family regulator
MLPGNKTILIAEDEKEILDLFQMYLEMEGHRTSTTMTGFEALRFTRSEHPHVVVLDLMLPDTDGLEVCRHIRSDPTIAGRPIMMVSAKAEYMDKVVGLELGADDYVTKPFRPRELVARVKALFRRTDRPAEQPSLRYGPLLLDVTKHEVRCEEQDIALTAKEFGLLEHLLHHRGRVLTRGALLNAVWGCDYHGTTRTVDVHVRRLKEKLPMLNTAIVSIKSLGYKLKEAAPAAELFH